MPSSRCDPATTEISTLSLHDALPICQLLTAFFFFNDRATTKIFPLSLHDILPIYGRHLVRRSVQHRRQDSIDIHAGAAHAGGHQAIGIGLILGELRRTESAAPDYRSEQRRAG